MQGFATNPELTVEGRPKDAQRPTKSLLVTVVAGELASPPKLECARLSPFYATSATERNGFSPDTELDHRHMGEPNRPGSSESETNVVIPWSSAGIVDAILAVGHQRQALLDQVRSALMSGNDIVALRFARQLCGLPD
jgi:hypothetical protein